MKQNAMNQRRARFGRVSLLLTVLFLIAVLLVNILVTALAGRYGWLIPMGQTTSYHLSDDCRKVIGDAIAAADDARAETGRDAFAVNILFCQEPSALEEDEFLAPVYHMATELADTFPGTVSVTCTDLFRNPTAVAKYRGESKSISIPDYSVIIDGGERWYVLSYRDFYELSSEDYRTTKGFSGNSRFATSISYLASDTQKLACLTTSHGEEFSDYEVQHLLTDAGYTMTTVDLRTMEIPDECTLLLTYAPKTDLLVAGSISDVSETDKIGAFLARGGSYSVFYGPDTPALPNLDGLLTEWGAVPDTHTVTSTSGTSETYRYMIRNEGASTTAGGFTLSAVRADNDAAKRVFETLPAGMKVQFPETTSFSFADGWNRTENGTVYTNGTRTASALYLSSHGSEAFAAGKRVEGADEYPLLIYSTDSASGGSVTVCGTLGMLSGDYLQSAVLGNRQAMLCLLNEYDGDVVLGIGYATWPSSRMETITTAEIRTITILLTVIPAVLLAGTGCVVLLRRKREN